MSTEVIRYEDAAELVTVKGWQCKRCQRFWGVDEHMAKWCCATELPCDECGGRNPDKHYTCCGECRSKRVAKKWEELYAKAVEWDGKTYPIFSDSHDRYFFDEDELSDFLYDNSLPPDIDERLVPLLKKSAIEIAAECRFRLCTPNNGRSFDMNEFLCDDLAEDHEVDAREVEQVVNDWIKENAPFSWNGNGKAIKYECIAKFYEEDLNENKAVD